MQAMPEATSSKVSVKALLRSKCGNSESKLRKGRGWTLWFHSLWKSFEKYSG